MHPLILMTRPRDSSDSFLDALRRACAEPFETLVSPVIEPVRIGSDIGRGDSRGVIFTSATAVGAVRGHQEFAGLTAYCVGDRTAQAATDAGFVARSAGGTVDDLVALINATGDRGPLLYLRGKEVSADLVRMLRETGTACREVVVYEQREAQLTPDALSVITSGRRVIAPVFSLRSARLLAAQIPSGKRIKVVGISSSVAGVFPEAVIAETPDQKGMIAAICRNLRDLPPRDLS